MERKDIVDDSKVWRWEESADARRTYSVFAGVLALGLVPGFQELKYGDLPYFISLAVITIYIGAHRGLNSRQRQSINLREGVLAPVAASFAIFATYLVVTYFPDFSFQRILDIYFWILGGIAIIGAFSGPSKALV